MANFDVVSQIDTQAEGRTQDISGERIASHVVQSIDGSRLSLSLEILIPFP
jgi:FKBP12-rapamycin complex-associated protein